MLKLIPLAAMLVLAMAAAAVAQVAPIDVQHAWARATPPGAKSAAVYMTIVNHGSADDRLISVTTPVAGKAELHETTMANGVMRMQPAGKVAIEPGTPLVLKPGSYHIMLTDLKQPLTEGQKVSLSLVFEKAGQIEATATVEKAGAMSPTDMKDMKM